MPYFGHNGIFKIKPVPKELHDSRDSGDITKAQPMSIMPKLQALVYDILKNIQLMEIFVGAQMAAYL